MVGGGPGGPTSPLGVPRGVPEACGLWVDPSGNFLRQYFLYIPKIFSVKFQVIPRTFISAQK